MHTSTHEVEAGSQHFVFIGDADKGGDGENGMGIFNWGWDKRGQYR